MRRRGEERGGGISTCAYPYSDLPFYLCFLRDVGDVCNVLHYFLRGFSLASPTFTCIIIIDM